MILKQLSLSQESMVMETKTRKQKAILFLVEGGSDKQSLSPFRKYIRETSECFDIKYKMFTKVLGYDLTTKEFPTASNRLLAIDNELSNIINEFANENKITFDDFAEIIQIVDMDGAFIPKECVKQMTPTEKKKVSEDTKILYFEDCIHTKNNQNYPLGTHFRNQLKRDALDHLVKQKMVRVSSKNDSKKIPYSVFFMSCNLEHFFYNERNFDWTMKIRAARKLKAMYSDKPQEFVDTFFRRVEFMEEMKDYKKAWKFITERNLNSLKRCSNVLLISDLCKELTDGVLGEQNNG